MSVKKNKAAQIKWIIPMIRSQSVADPPDSVGKIATPVYPYGEPTFQI